MQRVPFSVLLKQPLALPVDKKLKLVYHTGILFCGLLTRSKLFAHNLPYVDTSILQWKILQ